MSIIPLVSDKKSYREYLVLESWNLLNMKYLFIKNEILLNMKVFSTSSKKKLYFQFLLI